MFTDVLVVMKDNGSFAAKISDGESSHWINNGLKSGDRILIAEGSHHVDIEMDRTAVEQFKAGDVTDIESGKRHHRVVARATIDGVRAVGFFDTEGQRLGFKPKAETEQSSASIADAF